MCSMQTNKVCNTLKQEQSLKLFIYTRTSTRCADYRIVQHFCIQLYFR